MLHPSLETRLPELAATFRERGSLRLEPFLRDDLATELADSLRTLAHTIKVGTHPELAFLYYELSLVPEPSCDHVTCRVGRWLHDEGRAWVAELTGLALAPPPDGHLVATCFGKGCYLDPHNDVDGARAVAYVLGLTRGAWPAEQGGHLEFIDGEGDEIAVRERRAPGWNTLDLFDVRRPGRTHRVPLVTEHHERRAVSGWFYRPPR
jgi:hypothetical protein